MRVWIPVTLLVAMTWAGCLGEGDLALDEEGTGFEADWSERALFFGSEHDHADPLQHQGLTTPNFEIVGHDPLASPFYDGKTAGGYLCGDAQVTDDGRTLAAVESRTDVGFALADITDVTAPRWLGELVMRYTYIYDLAVAQDGKHVVLATASSKNTPLPLKAGGVLPEQDGDPATYDGLAWRTPCDPEPRPLRMSAEDPVPRPMSLILVDIQDPEEPTIVDHHPLAGYGHSVFPTQRDGDQWLMITTAGPKNPALSAYEFYRVTDTAAGARLEPVSVYKPPKDDATEDPARPAGPRGHDGWMADHPVTGDPVAYLAGGDRFTILDMSDPRQPVEFGRWSDKTEARDGYSGHLHSVFPLPELWDGRHYTLLGPEFCGHPKDHPTGILWVLDTTDPADVHAVAAWTLPHDMEWSGCYMFSDHYFTAHGTTAFMSMYHGGVWAIDLSTVGTEDFTVLDSIGVFMPVPDGPFESHKVVRWAPTLEEVHALPDGTLVTFDGNSGLYTFRFDAEDPAPPPEPWPIAPYTG